MPDKSRGRHGIVGAAGRTAVALLRSSRQRAKLSSLHLPISLHPPRHSPVAPPPAPRPLPGPAAPGEGPTARPAPAPEVRALQSRLAMAERRNARLRHALRRERIAIARASATLEQPQLLIDHLVADLSASGLDPDTARETVSAVLGAYGFRVRVNESPAGDAPPEPAAAVPGLDRRRMEALTRQLLAEQPEISSPRYVQAVLETLAVDGPSTLARLAAAARLTSPVARRRLRLALEGLMKAGIVEGAGDRYALARSFPELNHPMCATVSPVCR